MHSPHQVLPLAVPLALTLTASFVFDIYTQTVKVPNPTS